jgi:adenylate cyclase
VFAESLLRAGDTEADVAQRYAEGTGKLAPLLVTAAADVLRLHQLEQARRTAVDSAARATGRLPGAEEVTVCFADLVGFTKLGERVPADELGAVAGRLGEIASELVSPPVRLVKTIGDAAMLVSPENDPLLDTALDLVETAEDEGEGFPALHAGVARGEALTRAGDWYGAPVNLASRLTDFALPSSVVAAEAVRDVAARDYRWSFAGKRRFKGVKGEIAVFRVRRPEPEAG